MTQEQIIEAVEKMTVLELNTLVKAIEEKWGVSAAAVAVAGQQQVPPLKRSLNSTSNSLRWVNRKSRSLRS